MVAALPLSVALIGCGDIAESGHVPALMAHSGFRIGCVCDVQRERAERLALLAGGVAVETDYRRAIARADIDAVVLALHPQHSVDVAIDCLHAGLPVLDEKPLAVDLASAQRLAVVVAEVDAAYQVGFVFRYCDFVRDVASACARNVGPQRIQLSIYDERFESTETAHYQKIAGIMRSSSAVMHEGSHVFDYMGEWIAAPPLRVTTSSRTSDPRFPGPNMWSVGVDFADGSVLELEIGWLLPSLPPSSLRLETPAGWWKKDVFSGEEEVMAEGTVSHSPGRGLRQDWAAQLDAFSRLIREVGRPVIGIDAGMRALTLALACEQSARTGAAVELNLQSTGDAR